jgi:hypothetical protein
VGRAAHYLARAPYVSPAGLVPHERHQVGQNNFDQNAAVQGTAWRKPCQLGARRVKTLAPNGTAPHQPTGQPCGAALRRQ